MLEIYATESEFFDIVNVDSDSIEDLNELDRCLDEASRHVDMLTFNRIRAKGGFDKLTSFQKEVVKRVTCKLADFEMQNAEVLNSILSAYSINGVTMSFGNLGASVMMSSGVIIPKDLYNMLLQTGLCYRGV